MDNHSSGPKPQKHGIGFRFAIAGILYFFRTQMNAKVHLIIAALTIALGWFLGLSATEWLVVVLCIGLVLAAEMINTAIESLTDLVSPGYSKEAGKVKDIAAGAVLVAAIASAVAGLLIFLPKLALIAGTGSGLG